MRIPSGKIDIYIDFVAVDSVDLKTRKTGLTSFTVYRSRNGGTATIYTTPTIVELSASNMPGVYALLIDEDTTIASTSDSEQYALHITQASMAPVTQVHELYRRDSTSGRTQLVDANGRVDVSAVSGTAQTAGDIIARLPAALVSGRMDSSVGAMAAGVLTATAIAADAITDAKVASDVTIASVTGSVGSVASGIPTANDNADALLDRANGVETGYTIRGVMRLISAALLGKATGMNTGSPVFRNITDTKDRITGTSDATGDRSVSTLDPT